MSDVPVHRAPVHFLFPPAQEPLWQAFGQTIFLNVYESFVLEGEINGHQGISICRPFDDLSRCAVALGMDARAFVHDGLFLFSVLQPAATWCDALGRLG
jgi:hypothetical protein